MAIDERRMMARSFQDVTEHLTSQRAIIYALGVGLGADPCDPAELRHVYENGLVALPTMATTLGHPGFWVSEPDSGVNWRRTVHAEQTLIVHRPLPMGGVLTGRNRVEEILDRGEGKGATIRVRRDLFLEDGALQSSAVMSMIARDDGGFGGKPQARALDDPFPARAPDAVVDRRTLPQAALIYRLAGDYNSLHADPLVAREAGFERPILHGLCTYAVAGWSLVTACLAGDAVRLSGLDVRFVAPVLPGETVRTEIWMEGQGARFRSSALERGVTVLDRGRATFFNQE